MSRKHTPSPNDQRSIVKQRGTPAYEADRANRISLGHDNVPPPAPPQSPELTQPAAPAKK